MFVLVVGLGFLSVYSLMFSSAVLSALCLFVLSLRSAMFMLWLRVSVEILVRLYKGPFLPCSFSSLSNNSPSGLTHTLSYPSAR